MALDKQKILNELGSVVNQLQSADCGCMGKLFSNSNQPNQNGNFRNAPVMPDGCMRGCCHGNGCQGYNAPSAGEPFSGNRNCMGYCNPPKLYADTYNYLNNNLMQPVVNEVYNDLKSITPANTMMNSPVGAQMGLTQGNNPNLAPRVMPGQMGGMTQNQMPGQRGGMAQGQMPGQMGGMAQGQMPGQMGGMGQGQMPGQMGGMAQGQMPGQMGGMGQGQMPGQMSGMAQGQMPGQMGGMGQGQMPGQMGGMAQGQMPGSVNQNASANHHGPNVRFANTNIPMGNQNNQNQMGRSAPQTMSPAHGMGNEIVNMMMGDANRASNFNRGGTQGLMRNNAPQSPGMGQFNGGMPGNNMGMANNGPGNLGAPMQNPNVQYMSQPNGFAGANTNMQGNAMDGRMGQMNPGSQQMPSMSPAQPQMNAQNLGYGQHNAGMSKFNEMFPGVMKGDLGFDPMAIAIQMNPANQQQAAMSTMQKMMMSNGKGLDANAPLLQPVVNATNAALANVVPPSNLAPTSQQQPTPGENAAVAPVQNNQVPPQQVYTAQTGAPNTGAAVAGTLPTVYEGSENPNAIQDGSLATRSAPPTTQQMIKEPIFPADTSRNLQHAQMNKFKQQEYNTLGQPVDLLPAHMFHAAEPRLPQTLSPQSDSGNYPGRYSNVRATVSKTALMGNKPIGRTPSKGQLQQIYNQYKGSHSYTQQSIRPPENGASYSDGHLNVAQGNVVPQSPIEKLAGDTAANNAMNNQAYATGHKPGQVGDVPAANKPHGEGGAHADSEKVPVTNNSNLRNGLQDMKYTAYATTAAWSFHGATPAPYSASYRFRYKV